MFLHLFRQHPEDYILPVIEISHDDLSCITSTKQVVQD